jgi:hypothetical protein
LDSGIPEESVRHVLSILTEMYAGITEQVLLSGPLFLVTMYMVGKDLAELSTHVLAQLEKISSREETIEDMLANFEPGSKPTGTAFDDAINTLFDG